MKDKKRYIKGYIKGEEVLFDDLKKGDKIFYFIKNQFNKNKKAKDTVSTFTPISHSSR